MAYIASAVTDKRTGRQSDKEYRHSVRHRISLSHLLACLLVSVMSATRLFYLAGDADAGFNRSSATDVIATTPVASDSAASG